MIYFDNAATGGRKPDTVLNAVQSAIKVCANPGRSGHKLSLACAKLVQDCRYALNEFFDGDGFERVCFTKNCTEALNIAILGVLKKGDHVVVGCTEHNSVLRPLEALRKAGVITYDVCPLQGSVYLGEGNIFAEEIEKRITPKTRLVAVTTASNVTGCIPDLAKIKNILPKNVLFLCDGAQGGGHLQIKMKGAGIDLLTIAGHKGMLGIQGSGALLFSDRVELSPIFYGGTGSMSLSLEMPDFYPDALEAGTLSFPAILSLLEGVRYLSVHKKHLQSRLLMLTAYFLKGLQALNGYDVYSKANPCGIVAFSHPRFSSEQLADLLSERYDIAVRGGFHCAPLMHRALGTDENGLVRVSFSHFNSEREIDVLLNALTDLKHA
ncbi:MAG: aminotransferase class V-fold PLP-dependent enzyme [Clostridia bacterium]|nr:aminotransferase class V-fold PLP-dependent enzyme [Clostridia bacterium]